MKEIGLLVDSARAAENTPEERHDAFAQLVARFQDLAFACAYSVLKDFYLAEEVAQEAFVTAWQKLEQLREPEAFAGWFRKIVLTECHRLTRSRRLTIVPVQDIENEIGIIRDPQHDFERFEKNERISAAIKSLNDNERFVIILFYWNEFSQREIGQFLEVPVTTVVKRLYAARQKLKVKLMNELKEKLNEHRPSRGRKFTDRVLTRLRPLDNSDWKTIAQLAGTLEPDFRSENDLWMQARQNFDESRFHRSQYVVEHAETEEILGYGAIEQTVFLPKYRLFLIIAPENLKNGAGDLLLNRLISDLQAAGAISVWHRNYAHLSETLDFLIDRGFAEVLNVADLRLEIEEANLTMFEPVRKQVAALGVEITTLAAERTRDANCERKLHRFLNEVKMDDAARQLFVPVPFEAVRRYLNYRSALADACFIAKHGDEYVGFTDLHLRETRPGGLTCGFTGVSRPFRRSGVALVLKIHAIEYARSNNYRNIRAFNPPPNADMLALNEKLGFQRTFSYVTLESRIKQSVELDETVLDKYVGRYQPDAESLKLGAPAFTFKKIGPRLFSEARDMLDEMFAESETVFFTDHHYGKTEFVKDEHGQVTRMIHRYGDREIRTEKIC